MNHDLSTTKQKNVDYFNRKLLQLPEMELSAMHTVSTAYSMFTTCNWQFVYIACNCGLQSDHNLCTTNLIKYHVPLTSKPNFHGTSNVITISQAV